jgi:hypothetical protein
MTPFILPAVMALEISPTAETFTLPVSALIEPESASYVATVALSSAEMLPLIGQMLVTWAEPADVKLVSPFTCEERSP